MKKVWKGAAAAIAALSLGATGFIGASSAYADDSAEATAKIQMNKVDGQKEHTYNVWQIFTGTPVSSTEDVDNSNKLTDIKWGSNAKLPTKPAGVEDANWPESTYQVKVGAVVPDTVVQYIESLSALPQKERQAALKAFVNDAEGQTAYETVTEGADGVKVVPGYYLLEDTTTIDDGSNDAKGTYIVDVATQQQISPKRNTVESYKKIKDVADSTGNTTDWVDVADHDFGDTIDYKLTAVLPDNIADYTYYKINFVDTLSKGLTLDSNSATAKVWDVDPTSNGATPKKVTPLNEYNNPAQYSFSTDTTTGADAAEGSAYKDGTVAKWNFTDVLNAASPAYVGPTNEGQTAFARWITIEYTAKLNGNAVIGNPGNPNKFHVKYNTNPYSNQDGDLKKTEDDVNVDFTYEVDFDKVTKAHKVLAGAKFVLFKKFVSGEGEPQTVNYRPYKTQGTEKNQKVFSDTTAFTAEEIAAVADLVNMDSTKPIQDYEVEATQANGQYKAQFPGIDDGDYILVETTVPDGFNRMQNATFTIQATESVNNGTASTAATITNPINITFDKTQQNSATIDGNGNGTFTSLVENSKDANLPSTGGMGTVVLYTVGGLIVLIASVGLAVALRRRQA